ncbi:HPr family phosphocarrier protein [Acholeplasma sp. OttesenSCG-928-E16]|nr:HPr family phosphocarrier protein [Acholeplasma sp. OttesenSCG-928-E16]
MERNFIITAEYGLHARPATKMVNKAMMFDADLLLKAKGQVVNLKSVMGVMSLGIYKGENISIIANGTDEIEALDEMTAYLTTEGIGKVSHE